MNNIHFVIGTIGSGRRAVGNRLASYLSMVLPPDESVSLLDIGTFDTDDISAATEDNLGVSAIQLIEYHLEQFPKNQHHIVTGPLLALQIIAVFQKFPTASVYLVKNSNSREMKQHGNNFIRINSMSAHDVDSYNTAVIQQQNQLAAQLSLEWKYVEFPFIKADGEIKYTESSANADAIIAVHRV